MAAKTRTTPDQVSGGTATDGIAPKGVCRCEATIAPSVLDGYACGNPECWRTAVAQASFESFVADLIQRRDRGSREADAP